MADGTGNGEPPKSNRPPGAWIFVSHSHQDLDEVRRIRNELEEMGHNPLLFFLKCLGDDAELDELLQREIRARKFFLLCDSPNSRASRYVQDEVRFIQALQDKVYLTLDLKSDWNAQRERIETISRGATVFLSCARDGLWLAETLYRRLRELDYRVWWDRRDLRQEDVWLEARTEAMDRTVDEEGIFLLLLSPNALTSQGALNEMRRALEIATNAERSSKLVPVIAADALPTRALLAESELSDLSHVHALDFTSGDLQQNVERLLTILRDHAME